MCVWNVIGITLTLFLISVKGKITKGLLLQTEFRKTLKRVWMSFQTCTIFLPIPWLNDSSFFWYKNDSSFSSFCIYIQRMKSKSTYRQGIQKTKELMFILTDSTFCGDVVKLALWHIHEATFLFSSGPLFGMLVLWPWREASYYMARPPLVLYFEPH